MVVRRRRLLGSCLGAALVLVLATFALPAAAARTDATPTLNWSSWLPGMPASADDWQAGGPGQHARLDDHIWGLIPSGFGNELNPTAGPSSHLPQWSDFAGGSLASTAPLTYHGGPVMLSNTTYAIYWLPAGSTVGSNYTSLIDRYLGDVAAASGATDNVYSTDVQYYQGSSQTHIAYSSSFAGSVTDTTNPIPNSCSSRYTARGLKVTGCVTDADLQAEVARMISANNWTPSPTTMFFVFTPKNVGSCFSSGSSTCAYTYYCAYHSSYRDGSSRDVIYANHPFPDSATVGAPGACDSGQQPNGDWADQSINLISHEHNESITDPDGNAWYDSSGNENGDKCAWNFGTALGGSSGSLYNQVINGHQYYVQQEWSNASSSCALGYAPPAPPAQPTLTGMQPSSGPPGTSVTLTGAHLTGASAVAFNGTAATYTVNSDTQITAKVPTGASSGSVTVTTPGGSATGPTFTVTAAPPSADFTLAVSPSSRTVSRGGSTTYTVTITRTNGFAGSVQLSVGGRPSGTSTSWSSNPIGSSSTSSTLTVRPSFWGSRGTFTLTITGTSGSLTHSAQVTLVVQ